MPRNNNRYEAAEESDALDNLSRKLATDLRTHVRRLEAHNPLTPPWMQMIDSLQHIASIAQMEHKLPSENETTLWENDELSVRFLLEEGKLNLALRLMVGFCKVVAENGGLDNESNWMEHHARALGLDNPAALKTRLVIFEQALGQLLRCSLEHVEAVQTTDLPLLFEHASIVLGLPPDVSSTLPSQPAMVLRYLASVLGRIETMGEERMMPLVANNALVALVVDYLLREHERLLPEERLAGCAFLASAFDTEAFDTDRGTFIDGNTADGIRQFPSLFLSAMTSTHDVRKRLRPLLDVAQRG